MSVVHSASLNRLLKDYVGNKFKLSFDELPNLSGFRLGMDLIYSRQEIFAANNVDRHVFEAFEDAMEETHFVKNLRKEYTYEVQKLEDEITRLNQRLMELHPYKFYFDLAFKIKHGAEIEK